MVTHDFLENSFIEKNAKKTLIVILLTLVTMVAEIFTGWWTGSMALLADGWHMASHAAALFITYITYRLATHPKWSDQFNFGGGKIIPLGGYTSSLSLIFVALFMAYESGRHLLEPRQIQFNEAILVASIGLLVNFVSAFILKDSHTHSHSHGHSHKQDHDHTSTHVHVHHDHNLRGAFLHVVADAVTSIAAILALVLGKYWNLNWLDPLMGIVGAILVLKWGVGLLKDTAWELMDGHAKEVDYDKVRARIETEVSTILDLHIWKIAPQALSCELVVETTRLKGVEYYHKILRDEFRLMHVVVEEKLPQSN